MVRFGVDVDCLPLRVRQCFAGTEERGGGRQLGRQASKKVDLPNARYYDFDDIQIPNELSKNADKSKIFQTTNMTAGVLVFEGNVEVDSLITFFKATWPRTTGK